MDFRIPALNMFFHEVFGRIGILVHDRLHQCSLATRVADLSHCGVEAPSDRSLDQQQAILFLVQQQATTACGDVPVNGNVRFTTVVILLLILTII